MARRDGRNWSWRWQRAVTGGPRRTVLRSQIAGPAADPFGGRFRIWTGPGVLCTPGRGFLPAPPLTAGLSRSGGAGLDARCGAVAVQERTGEGASCHARVSTTSSRPWNGRPRGLTLHARPPGNLLIANPPRAPAPMADPPLWRGGCWPRCSAASAVLRARLAGAAGASAVPRGRTKRSRPAGGPRGDRTALRPDRAGHAVTA